MNFHIDIDLEARKGWICAKCGRSWKPEQIGCPVCNPQMDHRTAWFVRVYEQSRSQSSGLELLAEFVEYQSNGGE